MIMPAVFYATGNLIASTIGFAIAMIFAYNKKILLQLHVQAVSEHLSH